MRSSIEELEQILESVKRDLEVLSRRVAQSLQEIQYLSCETENRIRETQKLITRARPFLMRSLEVEELRLRLDRALQDAELLKSESGRYRQETMKIRAQARQMRADYRRLS